MVGLLTHITNVCIVRNTFYEEFEIHNNNFVSKNGLLMGKPQLFQHDDKFRVKEHSVTTHSTYIQSQSRFFVRIIGVFYRVRSRIEVYPAMRVLLSYPPSPCLPPSAVLPVVLSFRLTNSS